MSAHPGSAPLPSTGRRLRPAAFPTAFLLLMLSVTGSAQTQLNFNRTVVEWPHIEMYFTVANDGDTITTLSSGHFTVEDHGVDVPTFQFSPPPRVPRHSSIVLVLDQSGSMSGTGNAAAKLAARRLIEQMDGVEDEAAIVYSGSSSHLVQTMTADTQRLLEVVDSLPATGYATLWDGLIIALTELAVRGRNSSQSVILLTDGTDASSSYSPQQIIPFAQALGVRISNVGLGTGIAASELEIIALLTGGRYFNPQPQDLPDVFALIGAMTREDFREYRIRYRTECADGSIRQTILRMDSFGDSTIARSRTYRAPLDSSTFAASIFRIEGTQARRGTEALVPFAIASAPPEMRLPPFTCSVTFDTSSFECMGVTARPGDLLSGKPPTLEFIADGVRISSSSAVIARSETALFALRFRERGSGGTDTVRALLKADSLTLLEGCIIPAPFAGTVSFIDNLPVVQPAGDTSATLIWDATAAGYRPDPFRVTARVMNTGDATASGASFKLCFDSAAVGLVTPTDPVQKATPVDIRPGESAEASWECTALPNPENDSIVITVFASFENHPDVQYRFHVLIPGWGGPFLTSASTAPDTIRYDRQAATYDPNPFTVELGIRNSGAADAFDAGGTISLPAGMLLDPPDQSLTLPFTPSQIAPWQSGDTLPTVRWQLRWTGSETEETVQQLRFDLHGKDQSGRSVPAGTNIIPIVIEGTNPAPRNFHLPLLVYGETEFCDGGSTILTAGPGYASYRWSSGETSPGIHVQTSGSFSCITESHDGNIGYSDTVAVKMNLRPEKPTITRTGDVLVAPEAYQHNWYRNSEWLRDERGRFLAIDKPGRYYVLLITEHGCVSPMSDYYEVTVLGISSAPSPAQLDLFPNPSAGVLTLHLPSDRSGTAEIRVMDMLGRVVYETTEAVISAGQPIVLDITRFTNGPHIVAVHTRHDVIYRPVMLLR